MGVYQDTILSFAPKWWTRRYGAKFLQSFAGVLDVLADRVFEGRRAAIPYAGTGNSLSKTDDGIARQCDAEVLTWHAGDRGISLYATEPKLSQRVRLSQWRQLKKKRGSHQGELRNVQPYFLGFPAVPRMRIVHQSNAVTPQATWHTLEADGSYSVYKASPSNWNWDDQPILRARFWLIVYTDALGFNSAVWDGSDVWDGSAIWGGLFTSTQIDDLVAMVREAKAAHSRLAGIIFATDPTSFDPTSTAVTDPAGWTSLPVGNWGTIIDNDTGQPTRLPSAVFIDL